MLLEQFDRRVDASGLRGVQTEIPVGELVGPLYVPRHASSIRESVYLAKAVARASGMPIRRTRGARTGPRGRALLSAEADADVELPAPDMPKIPFECDLGAMAAQ